MSEREKVGSAQGVNDTMRETVCVCVCVAEVLGGMTERWGQREQSGRDQRGWGH